MDGVDSSLRRNDIFFWGLATLAALLLAMGRFFPLYSLFYQLPGVSSIRCPQKFIHVFQMGIGVLAAFGADMLLRGVSDHLATWTRRLALSTLILGGMLLLWAGNLASSSQSLADGFVSEGWSRYAPVMATNMIGGALHAATMTIIVGVSVVLMVSRRLHSKVWRYGILAALLLVMVVDVQMLARNYIKVTNYKEATADNIVTAFMKDNLNNQRSYMLAQQDPFYSSSLMMLFGYHNIELFNVFAMPRMPDDYDRWLKVLGKDPIRLWELSAIGYVLAPDQVWRQIQQEPKFASRFEAVKGFNLYASATGVGVVGAAGDGPAQHRILRFKGGLPRFKLFHAWEIVPDEKVNDRLCGTRFDPHSTVLLSPGATVVLPSSPAVSTNVMESVTGRLSTEDARVTAVVASPAILMFVNRLSPEWQATVDGRPVPLLRCNSLCMGVYLEPGRHEVVFHLRSRWGLFATEMAGLAVCFIALASLLIPKRKTSD